MSTWPRLLLGTITGAIAVALVWAVVAAMMEDHPSSSRSERLP